MSDFAKLCAADVCDRVLSAPSLLVAGHTNPDGDAVGSCVALCLIARAAGVRSAVFFPDPPQKRLRFLIPEGMEADGPDGWDVVCTVDVPYATNRELFASMGGARKRFSAGCAALENGELRAMMARVDGRLAPYTGGGNVFTDDKAPVELLGMRVIDGLIGDELDEVRGAYEEKGFSGLMEMLG